MYTIRTEANISGAHCLDLPYDSECRNPHGHNWKIRIEVQGTKLNEQGMLIDFTHIKRIIDRLDHTDINKVLGGINPTAENIAWWVADELEKVIKEQWQSKVGEIGVRPQVSKVSVQETEGNEAIWTEPIQ